MICRVASRFLAGAALVVGLAVSPVVNASNFVPWEVDNPDTVANDPTALLHIKNPGKPSQAVFIADVSDDSYSMSAYTDDSNTDMTNQAPEDGKGAQTWIAARFGLTDPDIFFVGGGNCDSSAVTCSTSGGNSGSIDLTGLVGVVLIGIHWDSQFAAFKYDNPLSGTWSIADLSHGVSNIFAFSVTPIPLPAALPLFGGALGILSLFGWLRRRTTAAA